MCGVLCLLWVAGCGGTNYVGVTSTASFGSGTSAGAGGGPTGASSGSGSQSSGSTTGKGRPSSSAAGSSSGTTPASSGGTGATGSSTGGGPCAGQDGGPAGEFGKCLYDIDCPCGFQCLGLADSGLPFCTRACQAASDCASLFTSCNDGGFCDIPACDTAVHSKPYDYCPATNGQCGCPLQCVQAFTSHPNFGVCETSCASGADCQPGEVCSNQGELVAAKGTCQPVCSPADAGGVLTAAYDNCDFAAFPAPCACPLQCVPDVNSNQLMCELPCSGNQDCDANNGEICSWETHTCTRPSFCPPDAGLNPEFNLPFQYCTDRLRCQCGSHCVFDPLANTHACEVCDDQGRCAGPPGNCQPPVTDAGLLKALPGGQVPAACFDSAACLCPERCVQLPNTTQASCSSQVPCQRDADCPDPLTVCQNGTCLPEVFSSFPFPNSFTCSSRQTAAVGTVALGGVPSGAGTFLPLPGGLTEALVCIAGGTATGACNAYADETQPDQLCLPGYLCAPQQPNGAGSCYQLCGNGFLAGGCPSGSVCAGLGVFGTPAAGAFGDQVCLPLVDAGDGFGCVPVGAAGPPDPVPNSGLCVCPQVATDAGCLGRCSTDGDCPNPSTFCQAGVCSGLSPCGADAGEGSACQLGSISAGVCAAGYCQVPGAAPPGASCDPLAPRDPAKRCQPGFTCVAALDGGATCLLACDATAGHGGCPSGQVCSSYPAGSAIGFAKPPPPAACITLSFDAGAAAGCQVGPGADLAGFAHACGDSSDCACGLACAPTPPGFGPPGLCLQPCRTGADCTDPAQVCGTAGCGFQGMPPNYCYSPDFAVYSVCDPCPPGTFSDSYTCRSTYRSDGTCIYRSPGADSVLGHGCRQGGTATGLCDPQATRATPDRLCVAGTVCDTTGPAPTCTPICFAQRLLANSTALVTGCASDQVCADPAGGGLDDLGYRCLPARGVPAGWDGGPTL